MAETSKMADLIVAFRETAQHAEKRARRRIVVTTILAVAAACYMTWLHASFSKLDAAAVTDIARAEVQSRLPELGDKLTSMAIDAAPGLMKRGEDALLSAPSALRTTLEERLASHTDAVLDDVAAKLDTELDNFVTPRLEQLNAASENGVPPPLDDLMQELRKEYRTKATALMYELYIAYSREIGGVNDYLLRLKAGENLSRRETIDKEIVEASVALRRHYIEPLTPIVIEEDKTAEK